MWARKIQRSLHELTARPDSRADAAWTTDLELVLRSVTLRPTVTELFAYRRGSLVAATLGGLMFLGVVCGLLIALIKRMKGTRWVVVGEQAPMTVSSADLTARLASTGFGRVITPAPGRAALVMRRAPVWVVAPVMLLFPVGLLFLLYREDVAIDITPDPAGGSAWLSGRTEAKVLTAVRSALVGA